MKTKIKKIFVSLLSVVMVFAMSVTAFASTPKAAGAKATLTIKNTKGATYTAYKVMNATESNDGNGNAVYTYTVTEDFKGFFPKTVGNDKFELNKDNEVLKNGEVIGTDGFKDVNNTDAAALASALEKYALENNLNGINVPEEGLSTDIGYYVVVETDTNSDNAVASKPILVNLTKDVEVSPKAKDIDLEKKIVENGQKVDANTANIGDDIQYEVTSVVPTYEANVDETKLSYVLTDTFTHLTYNNDAVLTIGGETLAAGVDYTIDEKDDQFVITLSQQTILNHQGESVVLKYSAKLNEDAVVDSEDGNPNHIKLEYTNNPNKEDSKGTLEDEVKTYTYGLKIHKVDKNDDTKDMSGAKFTIFDSEGNEIGSFEYGKNGEITNTTGPIITVKDGNYVEIKGLKDGKYTIREVKAPEGYSVLAEDVVVEIKDQGKEAGEEPNGVGKLEVVSGAGTAEVAVENHDGIIDLTVKIENTKGISLPETGSKTAMYCLLGGVVLLALGGLYFGMEKASSRKRH